MTPETVKHWRSLLQSERGRRSVSMREAADRLGVGYRTYCRYEREGSEDQMLALAMRAVLNGLPPFG